MKTIVLEAPHTLAAREASVPDPGPGEVLIRVHSAGICGSDLHAYRGDRTPYIPPVVLGHEFSGSVAALGPGVHDPAPGTRVTVFPLKSCGHCYYCLHGAPNLCDERVLLAQRAWPGAFADYLLAPASLLLPLPDTLSDDVGALLEPLTVGIHAVRRAGLELGESVLVLGCGPIGLMAILAARAAGAGIVVASDVAEFNLRKAEQIGATHTVNARSGDVAGLARAATGGLGVDRVLVAVDAPGVLEQAFTAARKRATIAVIAMFGEPTTLRLGPSRVAEQAIVGCAVYDESDMRAAMTLSASIRTELEAMVTHRFPLEDAARAFDLADRRAEDLVKILLRV